MKGQCVIGSIIDVKIAYKDDTYSGNFTSLINNLNFNIFKIFNLLDRYADIGPRH